MSCRKKWSSSIGLIESTGTIPLFVMSGELLITTSFAPRFSPEPEKNA
jgi:hypothetical protein